MARTPLLRLECDYCHAKIDVPANEPSSEAANWVQVGFNGEVHEFCSPSHAAQWLKNKSNIIAVPLVIGDAE